MRSTDGGRRRRRASGRRQGGFTLIELLVVVSILGILCMVVSMSLVGLTSLAHQRALDGERMEVQSALNFMIMDQGLDPAAACPGGTGPTNDMNDFPAGTPYSGQTGRQPVALHPHYLRGRYTQRPYTCAATGDVQPG